MKNFVISLTIIFCTLSFASAQEESLPNTDQPQEQEVETVNAVIVESAPIYPGCEDIGSTEDRRQCMSRRVSQHIGKNFDDNKMKAEGVPAGRHRIIARFIVNKDGMVSKITAQTEHELLRAETIRVLEMLPKMTPGTQRGHEVNVGYTLPISIRIIEEELSAKEKKRRKREAKKKGKSKQ